MNIFNLGRKYEELRQDYDTLHKALSEAYSRITELEKSQVEMQAAHAEDIKEIREHLDTPQRRKPTMRPWSMMRSIAEKGEQFIRDKQNA